MKKLVAFVVSLMLMAAFCTCALADDWTCPNCGRVNADDMNFCGNCRTEKPAQNYSVLSPMINAWVCSSCSHICPESDNFCTKCGADHHVSDPKAVLMDRPVLEEVRMQPISIQRIPCSHNHDSVTIDYTAPVDGRYRIWADDQTSDFSGKLSLYDNSNQRLKSNDFYANSPGLTCDLSAGNTYHIVMKGNNSGSPNFTLCIGEPRATVQVNTRAIICDSMDYYDQENRYLFVPQFSAEYRLDVAEIQSGQELDLKVKDELGYTVKNSSFGVSMGSGISFELEAGKPYYIIAEQRTNWGGNDLGYYKLQLSSPNPKMSVSGCNAVGDYLYFQYQKNTYEYTAPETGTYAFSLVYDAGCDYNISILDEHGYTVAKSSFSNSCHADLTGGSSYRIVVEQRSGSGDYSLFIEKE